MPGPTPSRIVAKFGPQGSHPARLSLGNSSPAVSTADHLRFQLDHALARDAVHTPLDVAHLVGGLRARKLDPFLLQSAAGDSASDISASPKAMSARRSYLLRPDLGRTLSSASVEALKKYPAALETGTPGDAATRIVMILADGLSSLALERHALPLLDATLGLIPQVLELIPVVLNARVALADPIGELLRADISILLIGERPGLSSPDSLGCYITWQPRPGRTDAERNCISNIRGADGLSYAEAAHRIAHYVAEATRLLSTGIALKDPLTTAALSAGLGPQYASPRLASPGRTP